MTMTPKYHRVLVKVSGEQARIPSRDLRGAQAFNAFFFSPVGAQWTLFSTHPSLERRLDELSKIAAQLGDQTPIEVERR